MAKELFKEVNLEDFKLDYYLIDDESGYGISVEKLSSSMVNESATVYALGEEKHEVCELIEHISTATVTPTGFNDVIEDWLEERLK